MLSSQDLSSHAAMRREKGEEGGGEKSEKGEEGGGEKGKRKGEKLRCRRRTV